MATADANTARGQTVAIPIALDPRTTQIEVISLTGITRNHTTITIPAGTTSYTVDVPVRTNNVIGGTPVLVVESTLSCEGGAFSLVSQASAATDGGACPAPPYLRYIDNGPHNVGTSCANLAALPSEHDWHFRVESVPDGLRPIYLDDNVNGYWVEPPCDEAGHWPLVATPDTAPNDIDRWGWDIYVAPWNAVNFDPPPNRTYTLILSNDDDVSDITAELLVLSSGARASVPRLLLFLLVSPNQLAISEYVILSTIDAGYHRESAPAPAQKHRTRRGHVMTTEVADAPTLVELGITSVPDQTQLPETDGSIVQNFQEHPQSILLTDSILPVLRRLHPDLQYCIGQDSGIYWNLNAALSDRPVRGAIAPDWFYVANVPPTLKGQLRRSYVLWHEIIAPLIAIEFVSGNRGEERDRTPYRGKFWIYENAIRIPYYAMYEVDPGRVEVYHLIDNHYELLPANDRGHYPIGPIGVELGIWHGHYLNAELPWLRWWDGDGNLLPTGDERAEQERERAEQARQAREVAQHTAERLAARLRALGIDPEADSDA